MTETLQMVHSLTLHVSYDSVYVSKVIIIALITYVAYYMFQATPRSGVLKNNFMIYLFDARILQLITRW